MYEEYYTVEVTIPFLPEDTRCDKQVVYGQVKKETAALLLGI